MSKIRIFFLISEMANKYLARCLFLDGANQRLFSKMAWSICTYELDSELVSGIGTGCSCTGGLCTVEAVNTLDSAN